VLELCLFAIRFQLENNEEFMDNLISPTWLFSVIVVGVVINLLSSYLKPKIDDLLSKISEKAREKNEKRRKEWEARVELLRNDNHEQLLHAAAVNTQLQRTTIIFLSGLLFFVAGTVESDFFSLEFQAFLQFLALVCIFIGIKGTSMAGDRQRQLKEARRK
jgi:hypothetical protein